MTSTIEEALATWLPHVLINKLNVEGDEVEQNQLNIKIEFSLTIQPDVFESISLNFLTGDSY